MHAHALPAVVKRSLRAFYDDQMTQHAAALTYYALMSLFPAALLGLSLLGLIGQYPGTYDSVMAYLRDVVPASALQPLDSSLRSGLQHKGTAVTALVVSVATTLYGATGVLESARRALNVVFEVGSGRGFLRRKSVDVATAVVLMVLVLATLLMVFVGGGFAGDLLGFLGLGSAVSRAWSIARWPGAVAVAMLVFALVYYVTPDVRPRSFRWVTPGAAVGVACWLLASVAFSIYLSHVASISALYGVFTSAILLVGWLWLTSCALFLGAEVDAELEREAELREGVPHKETLDMPVRGG